MEGQQQPSRSSDSSLRCLLFPFPAPIFPAPCNPQPESTSQQTPYQGTSFILAFFPLCSFSLISKASGQKELKQNSILRPPCNTLLTIFKEPVAAITKYPYLTLEKDSNRCSMLVGRQSGEKSPGGTELAPASWAVVTSSTAAPPPLVL